MVYKVLTKIETDREGFVYVRGSFLKGGDQSEKKKDFLYSVTECVPHSLTSQAGGSGSDRKNASSSFFCPVSQYWSSSL